MTKILQFAQQKKLTPDVVSRIVKYYAFKYRGLIFKEREILENISPKMRDVSSITNKKIKLTIYAFLLGYHNDETCENVK